MNPETDPTVENLSSAFHFESGKFTSFRDDWWMHKVAVIYKYSLMTADANLPDSKWNADDRFSTVGSVAAFLESSKVGVSSTKSEYNFVFTSFNYASRPKRSSNAKVVKLRFSILTSQCVRLIRVTYKSINDEARKDTLPRIKISNRWKEHNLKQTWICTQRSESESRWLRRRRQGQKMVAAFFGRQAGVSGFRSTINQGKVIALKLCRGFL